MKLKVHMAERNKHQDVVVGVDWSGANELLSVSDDRRLLRWSIDGELLGELLNGIDPFVTDIHCQAPPGQAIALAQANGQFILANLQGRIEATVPKQHQGSITCIRWSSDGSVLVSAGEDGRILQWSRSGNLRAKLAVVDTAIYCCAWSPDGQAILFASGPFLTLRPIKLTDKPTTWRAGSATVLALDWSPICNLIVSGGEDCKYSVFDEHGRTLFVSKPLESSVSSVAWAPNGALFAVASLDTLLLCDRSGWAHARQSTDSGSIMSVAWSADGTHLAGACVNGAVVFAQVVDRAVQWKHLEAVLTADNNIHVVNCLSGSAAAFEVLEFSDRVVEFSIGFGHLVICTSRQCYSYNVNTFATPHIFDLKGSVHLIVQSDKYFAMAGCSSGIRVYSYEGREISTVKVSGLQAEFLQATNLSMSPDTLALIDRTHPQSKAIVLIDVLTGAAIGRPIATAETVQSLTLSQTGLASDRKITWIDANHDLWIASATSSSSAASIPLKIATMVSSVAWNSENDALGCMTDTKLRVWYYPNVLFVDRDLLDATTETIEESFGRNAELVEFDGVRCTVRRQDGALVRALVSPYPALMYSFAQTGQWASAIRLARFINERVLWACLAAMAIHGRELDTSEACLAAIDAVDKLENILFIKSLPAKSLRDAEFALFRRRPGEAEQILLANKHVYRAIKLNLRLCKFKRALELATKYNTHLDTVVGYRQRYLQQFKQNETIDEFKAIDIKVDWSAIEATKLQEVAREAGK